MAKSVKRGLGRGLGALFGEDIAGTVKRGQTSQEAKNASLPELDGQQSEKKMENDHVSRETSLLRVSLIEPRRDQPRKKFDENSLNELAGSIPLIKIFLSSSMELQFFISSTKSSTFFDKPIFTSPLPSSSSGHGSSFIVFFFSFCVTTRLTQ